MFKLAFYTQLNSAIKYLIPSKHQFCGMPHRSSDRFGERNDQVYIGLFSQSIDKSSILAESTMKGKEYYCTGKKTAM